MELGYDGPLLRERACGDVLEFISIRISMLGFYENAGPCVNFIYVGKRNLVLVRDPRYSIRS